MSFEDWWNSVDQASFAYRDLIGVDRWLEWTPVPTSMTEVGTATYSGRFRISGAQCCFQVQIVPGTSTESTQGTTYLTLPITVTGLAGMGYAYNRTAFTLIGGCSFDITNSRLYTPGWTATGDTIAIAGWYEVER